jgi:hypothetical protein
VLQGSQTLQDHRPVVYQNQQPFTMQGSQTWQAIPQRPQPVLQGSQTWQAIPQPQTQRQYQQFTMLGGQPLQAFPQQSVLQGGQTLQDHRPVVYQNQQQFTMLGGQPLQAFPQPTQQAVLQGRSLSTYQPVYHYPASTIRQSLQLQPQQPIIQQNYPQFQQQFQSQQPVYYPTQNAITLPTPHGSQYTFPPGSKFWNDTKSSPFETYSALPCGVGDVPMLGRSYQASGQGYGGAVGGASFGTGYRSESVYGGSYMTPLQMSRPGTAVYGAYNRTGPISCSNSLG